MNALLLTMLLSGQWADPPSLNPGERVRLHLARQPEIFGMPLPQLRGARLSGTITHYFAEESVTLERDKWMFVRAEPPVVTFEWSSVYGVDVPNGRDWLGGGLAGAGYALSGALGVAFLCAIAGGEAQGADGCPYWKNAARFALITVPVGTIIGSQFTRWKRIYRRTR